MSAYNYYTRDSIFGPFEPFTAYLGPCDTHKYVSMSDTVPYELNNFKNHCQYIQKLVESTQETLNEIKTFTHELIDYTDKEMTKINQLVDTKPCFFVLGQNSLAKTCAVNALISQIVIPHIIAAGDKPCWKEVCLDYTGDFIEPHTVYPTGSELCSNLRNGRPQLRLYAEDLIFGNRIHSTEKYTQLDIELQKCLLEANYRIIITSTNFFQEMEEFIEKYMNRTEINPILIYAVSQESLSDENVEELIRLKQFLPNTAIFFVWTTIPTSQSQDDIRVWQRPAGKDFKIFKPKPRTVPRIYHSIYKILCDISYLFNNSKSKENELKSNVLVESEVEAPDLLLNPSERELPLLSDFVECIEDFGIIRLFLKKLFETQIINLSSMLHSIHSRFLENFMNLSYDLARDVRLTASRLEYVKESEHKVFNSLSEIASFKHGKFKNVISETISNMREELISKAGSYQFTSIRISTSEIIKRVSEVESCISEIEDLILEDLNAAIGQNLTKLLDCLKESYTGTLKRCVQNLENEMRKYGKLIRTSGSLARLLNLAYQLKIITKLNVLSRSILCEKIKRILDIVPWNSVQTDDKKWKQKVATQTIDRINEKRLANNISVQFRVKLNESHKNFLESLGNLEFYLTKELEQCDNKEQLISKELVPELCESILRGLSLRDSLLFGLPQLGKKIGCGRFGVVYNCESWGGYSPCAVKIIIPPNNRYWKAFSTELQYVRALEHKCIVTIRGSIIDHPRRKGVKCALYIIMDKFLMNLHVGISKGLKWPCRLQIAIEVAEGVRFLHNKGLVHRNIKLTNVLLNENFRAKITDLGCCMSESFVGYPMPIHVAPELFCGYYDFATDVYAFSILFWYICVGQVSVPHVFKYCHSKQFLWTLIKAGKRPERAANINNLCWELMEECWVENPYLRPYIIEVENKLRIIKKEESINALNLLTARKPGQKSVSFL